MENVEQNKKQIGDEEVREGIAMKPDTGEQYHYRARYKFTRIEDHGNDGKEEVWELVPNSLEYGEKIMEEKTQKSDS